MPEVNALIFSAEEDDAIVQLSENPVPETDFVRHCAQRRKYPILLKVEYPNLLKVNVKVLFIFFISVKSMVLASMVFV